VRLPPIVEALNQLASKVPVPASNLMLTRRCAWAVTLAWVVARMIMRSLGSSLRRGNTAPAEKMPLVPAPAPRPAARAVGLTTLVQVGESSELPIETRPGLASSAPHSTGLPFTIAAFSLRSVAPVGSPVASCCRCQVMVPSPPSVPLL
jgi:hypothetical protein